LILIRIILEENKLYQDQSNMHYIILTCIDVIAIETMVKIAHKSNGNIKTIVI